MEQDSRLIAQEAKALEQQFRANGFHGSKDNPPILVKKGNLPLIFSAPHAVIHPRSGKEKGREWYTGTLALQVASFTGASAIVYARTSNEDPNYDPPGPYKEALRSLVEETQPICVLDLHGMAKGYAKDVCIGIIGGKSLREKEWILERLQDSFAAHDMTMTIDTPFNAGHPHTITFFTSTKLSTPALQLEIDGRFREPGTHPREYAQLVSALMRTVTLIKSGIKYQRYEQSEEPHEWHADVEEHRRLLQEARKYKRLHPPSGEIWVYPPLGEKED
ncbi:MAG TPA: N-formylglutamate amidohydrolase [Ktedonobacterales bacterium]|nr:N-formylglutamate amidohydrolase [Ktedonobacterales bacterium]